MKMKRISIMLAIFGLVASIILGSLVADMDQAIIDHGIRAATRYRALFKWTVAFTAVLIGINFLPFWWKKRQRKRSQLERSKDEFVAITKQLNVVAKTNPSEFIRQAAHTAGSQLEAIEAYIKHFGELYIDGNIHVFEEVEASLKMAQAQMLQNAKSILNRINIGGDLGKIEQKITQNHKIIEDVKMLLGEMVNYLDNKSSLSAKPLESITYSLQMLNETLEEK